MNTLKINLDQRIRSSPRYKDNSVAEYFKNSKLEWWKPVGEDYNQQVTVIKNWLKKLHPQTVLELGAGFGRISEILDEISNVDLTIVDINKKALDVLRRKFSHREIVEGNVSELSYEKNKYDLVVAIELLVHIPDIESLVEKIYDSLKENGSFITSITPESWYKANCPGKHNIHRGIDEREFEGFISEYFDIVKVNRSSNNQLITYLLKKKG